MNAETGIAHRVEKLRFSYRGPFGVLFTADFPSATPSKEIRPSRERSVLIRVYLRQNGMGGWAGRQKRK